MERGEAMRTHLGCDATVKRAVERSRSNFWSSMLGVTIDSLLLFHFRSPLSAYLQIMPFPVSVLQGLVGLSTYLSRSNSF